ncbi:MAG: transposase [Patescibacteria group bacterium]|nr:transposase [Patescibacteria group bacterium]
MSLKTINIENHAYFVTSKVYYNLEIFVYNKFCQMLINNFKFYRKAKNFKLLGYVIMPNHLHTIIWPQGKNSISDIMRDFKEFTAKQIIKSLNHREALAPRPELSKYIARTGLGTGSSPSKILKCFKKGAKNINNQNYKVWQSRNWIENIFSIKFLKQKLNYIHNNPVRAKLVKKPEDYKYSSFKNYYRDENKLIKIDKIL